MTGFNANQTQTTVYHDEEQNRELKILGRERLRVRDFLIEQH